MFVTSFKVYAWQGAQKMTVVCRKADAKENTAVICAALKWLLVEGRAGKEPLAFLIFLDSGKSGGL